MTETQAPLRICMMLDYCAPGYGRPETITDLAASLRSAGHEVRLLIGEGDPVLAERLGVPYSIMIPIRGIAPGDFPDRRVFRQRNPDYRRFLEREVGAGPTDEILYLSESADLWALQSVLPSRVSVFSVRSDLSTWDAASQDAVRAAVPHLDQVQVWNPDNRGLLHELGAGSDRVHWNCSGVRGSITAGEPIPMIGAPAIVCCARIDANKNQRTLIAAMPEIISHHPQAHLTLVGEGNDAQHCRELAASLSLEERVTFAGFQEGVWRRLGGADIHILLSQGEGFAATLMEAMLIGTPVISSAEAAAPIEYGTYGEVIERPYSSASILGAINRIQADAGNRAEAAKQHALSNYTWEACVERTLHLLREVVAAGEGPNPV